MAKRLYLHDAQKNDPNSRIREMEMILDAGENPRQTGYVLQFFSDFSTYGVDEAIVYAEAYELNGFYKDGTVAKVKAIREKM